MAWRDIPVVIRREDVNDAMPMGVCDATDFDDLTEFANDQLRDGEIAVGYIDPSAGVYVVTVEDHSDDSTSTPDDPTQRYVAPTTIDAARLQMVTDLHIAVHGDTWARPEPASDVWRLLLDIVKAWRDDRGGD